MKIVICHAGYSGYLCACWRELAQRDTVQLSVYTPQTNHRYSDDILDGLPVHVLSETSMRNVEGFQKIVAEEKPDVVVISGWALSVFTALTKAPELSGVKFVLSLDSAWEGTWRQIAARLLLCRYLRRMDAVIVAGERGRQFVRYLDVPANKIFTSMYGFDYDHFKSAVAMRASSDTWPRSFVYVGRYAPVKGCDTLIHAYEIYRKQVEHPWPLHCYGTGPLKNMLAEAGSVIVHDFVQPQELPSVFSQHGVYILPSVREPWGVSLAEAAATGMPVICSDRVSSGLDIVRHLYDGLVFAAGDASALAQCFIWAHKYPERLSAMGQPDLVYVCAFGVRNFIVKQLMKRTKPKQPIVVIEHSELASAIKNQPRWRQVLMGFLERISTMGSDGLLCASPYLTEVFRSSKRYCHCQQKVLYFPYAFNRNITTVTESMQELVKSNVLADKKRILYMGTLAINYGILDILRAVKQLRKKRVDFVLYVLGSGRHALQAKQAAIDEDVDAYTQFMGFVPEEQLGAWFSIADVFVAPLKDTIQDKARCPSKVYMYLPFTKPVVTCPFGDPYQALGEDGFYYQPGNSTELAEQLDRALAVSYGWQPKKLDNLAHSWDSRANQFLDWCSSCGWLK